MAMFTWLLSQSNTNYPKSKGSSHTLRKNDQLQNPEISLPACEAKIPATVVAVAVAVAVEMALSPHRRHSTHPALDVLPFSRARRGDV